MKKANYFYNLPEDLINLIYRKYYSAHVMEELKERPGNFSWIDTDPDWECQLTRDYRIINNTPGAWEFLGLYRNFIRDANRMSPMFKKISNSVCNDSDHTGSSFGCSINIMSLISKIGWKEYKRLY